MRAQAFWMLFLPIVLSAQTLTVDPGTAVIRDSDTVEVTFRVFDENGLPITVLSPDQVRVSDNGVPVHPFTLHYAPGPVRERVSLILVLDVSGSMRHRGKIAKLQEAAKTVIQSLHEDDHCAIIAFSSKPRLLSGFTNDKELLRSLVENLTIGGATAIYDAVWEALMQAEAQSAHSEKNILLITDGREDGPSLLRMAEITPRIQVIPNVTMHVFDLNTEQPVHNLRRLAKLGRGSYHHNPDADLVFGAFSRFLSERRKSFALKYKTPASEEAERRISVHIRSERLEQSFETSYLYSSKAMMGPVWIVAGLVTACVVGIASTVAYQRWRTPRPRVLPMKEPLFVEGPRMAFDILKSGNGEEKTTALSLEGEDFGEKTVIIEHRKTETPVFGHLAVNESTGLPRVVDITSPEILLGRSHQCKVQFDNMEVSRLHAKLRLETDGFVLYDLGSANGTLVNGEEIQKRLLKDGDEIDVGNNKIVFHEVGTNGQHHHE